MKHRPPATCKPSQDNMAVHQNFAEDPGSWILHQDLPEQETTQGRARPLSAFAKQQKSADNQLML